MTPRLLAELFDVSFVNDEQPVRIAHLSLLASERTPVYQSYQPTLIYAHSGMLTVTTILGRFIVPPKQAICLLANEPFDMVALSSTDVMVWQIGSSARFSAASSTQVLEVSDFVGALLLEAMTISTSYQWHSSDGRLIRLILDRLMIASVIKLRLPYPKDPDLKAITERIRQHPTLKTDLVAWAKFVGKSVRTLSRRFKQETGITYSEWKQRLNIQIALNHLYYDDSVAHIAKTLGYDSSSAFIFMFKKHLNMTPSQYKKRFLS